MSRVLTQLAPDYDLTITKVDVTTHPRRALQDKITMIPTLLYEDKRLSGLWLSKTKIKEFLDKAKI